VRYFVRIGDEEHEVVLDADGVHIDGADVAAVEYLRADSLVTCRLGATTLAVRVPGAVGLARGDSEEPACLQPCPRPH
jgi:hypothetical protein